MTDAAPKEPRGIHNPRVIDLITENPSGDEVVLVMIEERPWDGGPDQLRQVEAKFNAYLEYVLGGHLAQQYPQYEGRRVCFQLDCTENPRQADAPFFTAMSNFAEGEGIRWVLRVVATG